ncbi:MAG: ATP-binding protein [Clostridia bacterium]|nr:ATP-binding protein [Clostridia bacterium]
MQIAIASGKGGTGKTTIATNLAYFWQKQVKKKVVLLDCDVEEPNCHLFLNPTWHSSLKATAKIPSVNLEQCTYCGKCSDLCQFGAISCLKDNVLVFPELCHSCGGCTLVCPTEAITETEKELGEINIGEQNNLQLIHGHLKIGEPMSPPLIKKVKEQATQEDLIILDCPPGTSCPVIQALKGSDFVLLITEPTPFGLHDLKLAVEVVRDLKIPFAVGINRSTLGNSALKDYCAQERIPIILEIPHERAIATAYSAGELLLKKFPQYEKNFAPLFPYIQEVVSPCKN